MRIETGLSEGQVLQRRGKRGATVVLKGITTSSTPSRVTATLFEGHQTLAGWRNRVVGRAAKGNFSACLPEIPAGGPYRLELRTGKETARIASLFVGDLWLLAGQSNMEGSANRSGAALPDPRIRAFSMRREWRLAEEPLHVKAESPDSCHCAAQCTPAQGEALRRKESKGVGPALHFAREMLRRTGVPQGLVCTAHGGTSMQQWEPFRKNGKGISLYGSFLLSAKAAGPIFSGLLWYQGESDANPVDEPLYTGRMRKLVAATRRDLRQPRLPWIIVQLGRHIRPHTPAEAAAWNGVQEQQRLLPGKITALEVVAAIDLPLDDTIHIGADGVAKLGDRLARAADRLALGNRREPLPPRLRSIGEPRLLRESFSRVIDVTFENVPGGLRALGEPSGFTLVASDGNECPGAYRTSLRGNTARVHIPADAPPGLRLSYGYGKRPACNLTDERNMALPVFGPLPFGRPAAYLPFITEWRTSGIVSSELPLGRIARPQVGGENIRRYEGGTGGFVNEHVLWQGRSGQAYFASRMDLPELMRLEILAGYDGPFRLWIGDAPAFGDLAGINPCFPDKGRKEIVLAPGLHELTVAMDLNHGLAWGFYLRFRRLDVSAAQIASGQYSRPTYLP
ncbi:sialate O-acetylesterase [Verrucomicrobium sp. GAS474]|uniref:sialate O-acetylesterase n=1 Tax=Verrucomicrobium sp. GAS474 TaxID=1882831 RepID=UPI00087A1FB5|nr:sialate O-acetylesterase [Verrucomicrobium sp. GAS474]SDU02881.1 sialate O-acetylesterase [Verrucomicrobium sp. GAS474]